MQRVSMQSKMNRAIASGVGALLLGPALLLSLTGYGSDGSAESTDEIGASAEAADAGGGEAGEESRTESESAVGGGQSTCGDVAAAVGFDSSVMMLSAEDYKVPDEVDDNSHIMCDWINMDGTGAISLVVETNFAPTNREVAESEGKLIDDPRAQAAGGFVYEEPGLDMSAPLSSDGVRLWADEKTVLWTMDTMGDIPDGFADFTNDWAVGAGATALGMLG